jgi:hypothetical protein
MPTAIAAVKAGSVAAVLLLAAIGQLTSSDMAVTELKETGFPTRYRSFNLHVTESGEVVQILHLEVDWERERWRRSGPGALEDPDVEVWIPAETCIEAHEAAQRGSGSLLLYAAANSQRVEIKPARASIEIRLWAIRAAATGATGQLAARASRWGQ